MTKKLSAREEEIFQIVKSARRKGIFIQEIINKMPHIRMMSKSPSNSIRSAIRQINRKQIGFEIRSENFGRAGAIVWLHRV